MSSTPNRYPSRSSLRDFGFAAIWKNIGMAIRSKSGAYLKPDNVALFPIYEAIQNADRTLLVHVADPIRTWMADANAAGSMGAPLVALVPGAWGAGQLVDAGHPSGRAKKSRTAPGPRPNPGPLSEVTVWSGCTWEATKRTCMR
jgi:hypothetical protein